MATICMKGAIFDALRAHLLAERGRVEQAAFAFASTREVDGSTIFDVQDWMPVVESGFAFQSDYHIELTDEIRASVIKRAWDNGTSMVEFHSHVGNALGTSFSASDLLGLEEFVPHVWWRLKRRPYAAVVMGSRDFDALAWTRDPRLPQAVTEVRSGDRVLIPTGITIASLAKEAP